MNNCIVVNLLAGSGAGKSTNASRLFAMLKDEGIEVELVSEWVKDMVWEGRTKIFGCQDYIFGKQLWKQMRVAPNVEVIITDCPIILSALYDPEQRPIFKEHVLETFHKFNNMNFFLNRVKPFNPNGRNEKTVEEARENDKKLMEMLDKAKIEYSIVDGDENGCEIIFKEIIKKLKKQEPKQEGEKIKLMCSDPGCLALTKGKFYEILNIEVLNGRVYVKDDNQKIILVDERRFRPMKYDKLDISFSLNENNSINTRYNINNAELPITNSLAEFLNIKPINDIDVRIDEKSIILVVPDYFHLVEFDNTKAIQKLMKLRAAIDGYNKILVNTEIQEEEKKPIYGIEFVPGGKIYYFRSGSELKLEQLVVAYSNNGTIDYGIVKIIDYEDASKQKTRSVCAPY